MKPRISGLKTLWPLLPVAAAGIFAFARRTRGYNRIAEELRSPFWRIQTPSIGPNMLRILQPASQKATACVDGVTLEERQIQRPDGSTLAVYVYRPRDLAPGGPAMLYTHGGGMILGSARRYHVKVSAYARDLGLLVVSAEYRLAPQHPFPAPLDDVYAAYRWLVATAGELSVDANRLAVAGESAGGGLTAALCQRVHDAHDHAPIFQCLIYPMIDDQTTFATPIDERGQLFWSRGSNRYGWACYLGHTPDARSLPDYAAPARRQTLTGLPPAWIGVGELDLFHDEAVDYGHRLASAGVPCETIEIKGAFHGFDLTSPDTDIARSFRASIIKALRRALA